MHDEVPTPPGLKWILILGAAAFAAGFIGPMIFVPDANQGPMVGIFISAPAGILLGLLLRSVCTRFNLPAPSQWRLLYLTASIVVLATLLLVQPEPALRGYVYEGEVISCDSPGATEPTVIAHWNERIAKVTWAEPRAGWQEDMHQTLRDASGVVVSVRVQRKNPIRENRKPWNRGSQFASGWTTQSDETLFYDENGSCDRYPQGHELRGFQAYDYNGRIEPPTRWPPAALIEVLGALVMAAVPEKWQSL